MRRLPARWLVPGLLALGLAGCGSVPAPAPTGPSVSPSHDAEAEPSRAPTPTRATPAPTATDDLVVAVPSPTVATTTAPTAGGPPGGSAAPAAGRLTTLVGDTRSAMVWAPLSDPSAVTTEGSVPSARAWSTSKVLVVAAYLDTVVGGDPSRIPSTERGWIRAALTASDGDAVVAVRDRIPGSPGAAITAVLRSIGDTRTSAPDRSQGMMTWTPREQVRFMAALAAGRVVSPEASAYLLAQMQPIAAHRWGLGTIGASSFKGGWLTSETETRQMGIVGGYAVAIITVGVGPAVRQTDGDSAHVHQMDRIADLLARRLG
ncbi:serine hydrolase [Phycicoccus duodecadis]|uniref:serine hydrolase n=1 Tax=Phycicoccus duodecadis TaxID=173053 RepID=UPI000C713FD3|nr:serine hydrolase [Phycicoccus duodecadis]